MSDFYWKTLQTDFRGADTLAARLHVKLEKEIIEEEEEWNEVTRMQGDMKKWSLKGICGPILHFLFG